MIWHVHVIYPKIWRFTQNARNNLVKIYFGHVMLLTTCTYTYTAGRELPIHALVRSLVKKEMEQ